MQCSGPFWSTFHPPESAIAVHRHRGAYAAFVLEGSYEEASVDGRLVGAAGSIMVHPAFHAHANSFGKSGARVFNLHLPACRVHRIDRSVAFRPAGFAELLRLALGQAPDAVDALMEEHAGVCTRPGDAAHWVDDMGHRLAQDALAGRRMPIGAMAAQLGVSPQHASRAFRARFGMTPSAYRLEFRLRHAAGLIRDGARPIRAALEAGFSDQSHCTREMGRRYDITPGRLARSQR